MVNKVLLSCNNDRRTPNEPKAQWMEGKYGIMVHWLAPGPPPQFGEYKSDLNEAIDDFDVEGFMKDFDRTGADWLIFTIGQNTGYYASPNSVIDSLAGPGHTPERDLVLEIARAVKRRGKKFIAYLPCEVNANTPMHEGFAWNTEPGTDQAEFQARYLRAVREWALRFGDNLDGWWIDGSYYWDIFHNKYMRWEQWYDALRAGNPASVLTFNDGSYLQKKIVPIMPEHDYLPGECFVLVNSEIRLGWDPEGAQYYMPQSAYVDSTNCLNHALLPIDAHWAHGSKYPDEKYFPFDIEKPARQDMMEHPIFEDKQLFKFVKDFTDVGGAVTLNVGAFQEGRLGEETLQQLDRMQKYMKEIRE